MKAIWIWISIFFKAVTKSYAFEIETERIGKVFAGNKLLLKIGLWTRFLLLFQPIILGVDYGKKDGDHTVEIKFKKVNGIIVIQSSRIIKPKE